MQRYTGITLFWNDRRTRNS